MYEGRYVFTQLFEHLPLHTFRRAVRRYEGERYIKSFSCYDQFLCMAFAQLSGRESLRDIERQEQRNKQGTTKEQGHPSPRNKQRNKDIHHLKRRNKDIHHLKCRI